MPRKHNTKHRRSASGYKTKVQEQGPSHLSDPILSDGKRSTAKR